MHLLVRRRAAAARAPALRWALGLTVALALLPLAPRGHAAAGPGATMFDVCTADGMRAAGSPGTPDAPVAGHAEHCVLCTTGASGLPPCAVATALPAPAAARGAVAAPTRPAPLAAPWPDARPRAPPLAA